MSDFVPIETSESAAEIIRDLAVRAAAPVETDVTGVLVSGQPLSVLDLEDRFPFPRRKMGNAQARTLDGLLTYAQRHRNGETSTLWVDADARVIQVVFNDHAIGPDGTPGFADHRVVLRLKHTPEWIAWTERDGRWVSQTELAEFLEERFGDVIEPDGATMLETAKTFHATTSARFKSAIALHSGEQQLIYEQEVAASAGRTQEATIPREFKLALPPFLGSDFVELPGLFRFRVREGNLSLSFKLLNIDQIVTRTIGAMAADAAAVLDLAVIEGAI